MAANNPFEFLEQTLTTESLQALRRVDRETARRAQQSMTANERSGFAVGNMLFGALSNAFGPGKKQRELAQAGDAALETSAEALEQIPEETFTGPEGGIKRNLARAEALVAAFQEQGLQEDAMRAQIAANNLRNRLQEAEAARKSRELTDRGQALTNEKLELANTANRRMGLLNAQTYYVDTSTGEVVDRLDSRRASFPARQQQILQRGGPSILPLSRDEYLRFREDQQDERLDEDFQIFTNSDWSENRDNILAQDETLRLGNRILNTFLEADSNPLTTVSATERFANRLLNEAEEVGSFLDRNIAQAEQAGVNNGRITDRFITQETQEWMQKRGIERQISASLLGRLTWSLTRQYNGSRPTDLDYARIYDMLGGDSGDPTLMAKAFDEIFALDTEGMISNYDRLLTTEGPQGRTYGQTQRGGILSRDLNAMRETWSEFQGTHHRVVDKFGNQVSSPAEAEEAERRKQGEYFDGAFTIPGLE